MRQRHGVVGLVGAILAIVVAVGADARAQTATDASPRVTDLAAPIEAAIRAGDGPGVGRALDGLWQTDREKAREMSWQLVADGTPAQQPLGLEAFGRFASAKELASAAASLDMQQYPDARRWLVRSIGRHPDEGAPALARPFLEDRDPYVRGAAAWALADLGDVGSVAPYARRLKSAPTQVESWGDGDDESEQMALYGAVRTLTGLRPESSRDVLNWVRDNRDALDGLEPPEPEDPALAWRLDGNELTTPSLLIQFELGESGVPPDAPGDPGAMSAGFEEAVRRATRAAEPIFGRVHLPVIRVVLADDQSIARFGGTSRGYYGFARGNKVAMRLTQWRVAQGTLAHEYIHIIHGASSERQPRWLSEGLAETLTRSPAGTRWADPNIPGRARLFDELSRAGVSGIIRWESDGSSGEDPDLYAKAHIVLDYLRFGGFGAENARLMALIGRITRGEQPQRALETVYGRSVRELDEGLAAWLRSLSPPGDG